MGRAWAAVFLASSDEACFITATEVVVDGGKIARCDWTPLSLSRRLQLINLSRKLETDDGFVLTSTGSKAAVKGRVLRVVGLAACAEMPMALFK